MNEPFDLPVSYNGEELMFPSQLLSYGYTHKFKVDVHGQEIFFEPDEDNNYRAIIDPLFLEGEAKIDIALLHVIADSIEPLLK